MRIRTFFLRAIKGCFIEKVLLKDHSMLINETYDDSDEQATDLTSKLVKSSNRFHALDTLRALAMLLGVLLHSVIAYTVNRVPFWPVEDPFQHSIFDVILGFIHVFRLELFFLIAGFFAHFIYQNKGHLSFIKNRFQRIGMPLVLTWPLILTFWLLMPFPKTFIHDLPIFHLWFLYYLLIFYTLFIFLTVLLNVFKKSWTLIDTAFAVLLQSPYYSAILVCITAPILLLMDSAFADTPFGCTPLGRVLLHYGIFFSFGVLLHRQTYLLNTIANHRRVYLFIAIPSTISLFILFSNMGLHPHSIDLPLILLRINYAVVNWSVSLCLIGFFQRYFNTYNPVIRYLVDASYWIYLAHLPLVILFQYLMLNTPILGPLKPLFVFTGALLILIPTYHLLVRFTWVGNMLNGPRLRPMLPVLRY